jgi:RNA recognition motif-containing protein
MNGIPLQSENPTFTKKSMNLFVAGLPYDLDDAELEEIFEKFGKVVSAKVVMDRETGKSKGFGFVEMPNEPEAKEAIEHLNDISLGKKPLVVKAAEDRPSGGGGGFRPNTGRPPGGGFNKRNDYNKGGGYNRDRGRDRY